MSKVSKLCKAFHQYFTIQVLAKVKICATCKLEKCESRNMWPQGGMQIGRKARMADTSRPLNMTRVKNTNKGKCNENKIMKKGRMSKKGQPRRQP